MISITFALEIMKAVTDNNIQSEASVNRRKAFDEAVKLKSLADIEIVLDGQVYERIEPRLAEGHKYAIQDIFRIDNASKDIVSYDLISSLDFLAERESQIKKFITVTENCSKYKKHNNNVLIIDPTSFLTNIEVINSTFIKNPNFIRLTDRSARRQLFTGAIERVFFTR